MKPEILLESQKIRVEETLDPQDWDSLRRLGHQMLNDMFDHLSRLGEQPAWQPMPQEVRDSLSEPLPLEPQGAESVYQEFLQNVLPYPNGNLHPRFYGWVQGNGTPLGMLADMLASGMNPHMAGFNQAPALVETQVINWLRELMGMPEGASGLLTSGGTMAGINGLVVARHVKAGFNVREEGLQGNHPMLTLYGSTETHSWAKKAVELLGLGNRAFRRIPVDNEFQIDLVALRDAIAKDRQAGHQPFCVIGNAGTVNTGATDDLTALAQLCRDEDLWFHVDGAFGALAYIAPSLRPIVAGIEQADSISFDLHKWMYLPFEAACVLVRDAKAHVEAFTQSANYLAETTRGVSAGGLPFSSRGVELTRGFKALKVWMSLKAHGINSFSRLIEQNVNQARYLVSQVHENPSLELLAPAPMNVVCFRFYVPDVDNTELNKLNEEIMLRLQENGVSVPSSTLINGSFALRVANVNHRTQLKDFDLLVNSVIEYGNAILSD